MSIAGDSAMLSRETFSWIVGYFGEKNMRQVDGLDETEKIFV